MSPGFLRETWRIPRFGLFPLKRRTPGFKSPSVKKWNPESPPVGQLRDERSELDLLSIRIGRGIICAHKSGSSVHTGFPHLLRHALWIICAHKVSVIWIICTHTHFWQGGGVGWGGGLVSTPAQVRPLSTVGGWGGLAGGGGNGKHTRPSAPAQRCFHACGRVARRGGGWGGGNGRRTRSGAPARHCRGAGGVGWGGGEW